MTLQENSADNGGEEREDNSIGADIAAALAEIESGDHDADDEDGIDAAGADDSDAADETGENLSADGSAGQGADDKSGTAANAAQKPSDFTAEEAAAWEKLPDEAKQLLTAYSQRSQASRSTVATELDGLKKSFAPVQESFKPYAQHMQVMGVTPAEAVSNLMPYYVRLAMGTDEQKREAINHLVQTFGVTQGKIAPQENENEYLDPEIIALRKQVSDLQGMVSKTAKGVEDSRVAEAQAQVDAFRDAKDEKGALKHPHFAKVEARMGQLLQAGLAKTLDDAYDQASRLDPEVRGLTEKAQAEAKRAEDAAKAEKAKKAAALNRKGNQAPAKKSEGLSIKDSVAEAYAELGGF